MSYRTCFAAGLAVCATALVAADTTVRVTRTVLVRDVMRFGINCAPRNAFYDVPYWKVSAAENFETDARRRIVTVASQANKGIALDGLVPGDDKMYAGGTYVIISGASKWTRGSIAGLTVGAPVGKDRRGNPAYASVLRTDVPRAVKNGDGILLAPPRNCGELSRNYTNTWGSRDNALALHDTRAGSYGLAVLRLHGATAPAFVAFPTHWQSLADANGQWRVAFSTKAKSGAAALAITPCDPQRRSIYGDTRAIPLTRAWRQHDLLFCISNLPVNVEGEREHLMFRFDVTGGDLLLDDVVVERAGQTNPTAWRDDAIAALQHLRPGVIRILQGSGRSVLETIYPKATYGGAGLHNLYGVCEYVGAEPYYCLPATMTKEEMTQFMEYLGAPATTGWGRLRAQLGHPKPWTETLHGINIEIGNELYNFGGYGGPDYWHDLIAAGKSSPYYDPKVFFSMSVQGNALAWATNTDSLSLAGYVCWGFTKEQAQRYMDTNEKLFHWAMGWVLNATINPGMKLHEQCARAAALGIQRTMYEGGYHINFGNGPSEPRNKVVTSLGGAVNYINKMLLQLREYQMRKQCYFNFVQRQFVGSGAFGSPEAGTVRLWGSALRFEPGKERFRPSFLALATVNKVLRGDMLATEISGTTPTFTATGPFGNGIRDFEKNKIETLTNLPSFWSYAFRDGSTQSLILVNLELAQPQPVRVEPAGTVAGGAHMWLLSGDSVTANNELDWHPDAPQVTIKETELKEFARDRRIVVPAHAMLALTWCEQ